MPKPSLAFRVPAVMLGAVFLWAALGKLTGLAAFARAIGDYGLVWEPLLGATAWAVVAVELVAGSGLVLGRRCSIGLATALLVVFLAVLGYGIGLGLDIECGCFQGLGRDGQGLTLKQAFTLDCGLLAACGWLWWSSRRVETGNDEGERT